MTHRRKDENGRWTSNPYKDLPEITSYAVIRNPQDGLWRLVTMTSQGSDILSVESSSGDARHAIIDLMVEAVSKELL